MDEKCLKKKKKRKERKKKTENGEQHREVKKKNTRQDTDVKTNPQQKKIFPTKNFVHPGYF